MGDSYPKLRIVHYGSTFMSFEPGDLTVTSAPGSLVPVGRGRPSRLGEAMRSGSRHARGDVVGGEV